MKAPSWPARGGMSGGSIGNATIDAVNATMRPMSARRSIAIGISDWDGVQEQFDDLLEHCGVHVVFDEFAFRSGTIRPAARSTAR